MSSRARFLASLAASALALLALALPASAAIGPAFNLTATSNTNIAPGATHEYSVRFDNVGDSATNGEVITFTATMPPDISALSGSTEHPGDPFDDCVVEAAGETVTCSAAPVLSPSESTTLTIPAAVAPTASGIRTASFEVKGGGALAAHTADPVTITSAPPVFGIDAYDGLLSADATGAPASAAASHPYAFTTAFDFNLGNSAIPAIGAKDPIEDVKDVFADLPPGLIGNPNAMPQCTVIDLASTSASEEKPSCPQESQVGVVVIRGNVGGRIASTPVFNLQPPPGSAARFGFNIVGGIIVLDAHLRSASDYGITVLSHHISQAFGIAGTSITFWGDPADEAHFPERHCPGDHYIGAGGEPCPTTAEPQGFLRTPTACTASGLNYTLHADPWQHPAAFTPFGGPDLSDPKWDSKSYASHQAPGYPYPEEEGPAGAMSRVWGPEVGIDQCDQVPFEPSFSAQPTTDRADSPSGLTVDIDLPTDCWEAKATAAEVESSICQSELKDAKVKLPEGMSLNPSAASGLAACSAAQVGLTTPLGSTPIHFDEAPVSCPDSAKIGSVAIETPVLDHPLNGTLYIARQGDNPFKSLLAVYLVVEDFQTGVKVKLAGHVAANEQSGQLETTFDENPQLPFSSLHLELYGGPRAALRTPPTCGTYTTNAAFTPWAGNPPVNLSSSFQITNCPNSGFDPKLSAGTQNPLAGSFSPFNLRLSREDGTAELGALRLGLPPGLVASLKDIPYCNDATLGAISGALGAGQAEINSPSCPKGSQVGTVTAGAGAGPNPFYSTTGRAYWAGPYKGAPVSLAVVVPAVAGPFDLGSVVVRNRFEVDPETARITAISDPFPSSLYGIPLDLRDVRVDLNRPDYTLNPTNCDPMAFDADIGSSSGQSAHRSVRFQVAGCDRLRFKPKLSLKLSGKTTRGGHPALRAIVTMPKGGTNLAQATVSLPHSEFLDQSHIGTVCTRVQYAAGGGGGEQCPPKSVYGKARVYSPILGYYLQGPVFLRSSSHKLPDLVLGLRGPPAQPIVVSAVGRIDSTKAGGIRTSFESVPDVPVSKVVLDMRGGKKGLLQNSTNICKGTHLLNAKLEAHNAQLLELQPEIKADCGGKARKGKAGDYRR